jgi:hypothetical protein
VKGDNIKGWQAMREYAFNGVRNVLDNQIAKSLTPDVARFMLSHFERATFYLGALQEAEPRAATTELTSLVKRLTSIVPPPAPKSAFPTYNYGLLLFKLQKGVEDFRNPWRAYLGKDPHSEIRPLPWQSVKAVSRRYAEGFDDGYPIRPASNLLNSLTLAIGRFVESPADWEGTPSADDKRVVLDRVKATVSRELANFCALQLREKAKPEWLQAYGFRERGSTLDRREKIESLFERWVPIPRDQEGDMQHVQEFIEALTHLVKAAIETTRQTLVVETAGQDE